MERTTKQNNAYQMANAYNQNELSKAQNDYGYTPNYKTVEDFVEVVKESKPRTLTQNRALHKMFETLAGELNDRGKYISTVIRADARWDKNRVKELIWRAVQEKMFNKTSTTSLTTSEIDEIFEVIQKALAEMGIVIVFPSIDSIMDRELLNEQEALASDYS